MLPVYFNIWWHDGVCLSLYVFDLCSIVLIVFLSGSIAAWAYEETTVSNGGTVSGTVQFSGELAAHVFG
jgi:hypothetical protein